METTLTWRTIKFRFTCYKKKEDVVLSNNEVLLKHFRENSAFGPDEAPGIWLKLSHLKQPKK